MNLRQNMIIANDKIITPNVIFCKYNSKTHKYDIKFKTGQIYSYGYNNVTWIKEPKELNPSNFRIMHNKKKLYDISAIFIFRNRNQKYWHICFDNGKEIDYSDDDLIISFSCSANATSKNVFNYLKETAEQVSIRAEDGTKLLSKQYDKLDYVGTDKAFLTYVNPKKFPIAEFGTVTPIFPFGCNASQYKAVTRALRNKISVIQGPPGTGKTQTILNIIANLLIAGKTVQVVSNNNSATENVLEKLSSPEYDFGFLVAPLGNSDNKKCFIQEQVGYYPKILKCWGADVYNDDVFFREVRKRSAELNVLFNRQELLAKAKLKLGEVRLEYEHFQKYLTDTGRILLGLKIRKKLKNDQILESLRKCQNWIDNGKKLSIVFKIRCRFIYGIAEWSFYNNDASEILNLLQTVFYISRITELEQKIEGLEITLKDSDYKQVVEDFSNISMKYMKAKLHKRFGNRDARKNFVEDDLCTNPDEVLNEYPVVLSTTFSARSSLCASAEFDYLIMDEASQVDVVTGALALSCAKNAVIVGDEKQLPNVVTNENKIHLQQIFNSYDIDKGYNFVENSLLTSICNVIPGVPKTLLREHYRCHPKIINFCNQKFYAGELIIMTEDKNDKNTISVMKTVVGNHQRDHMNQRQIDVINQELLPSLSFPPEDIGIIAPYNNQVKAIQNTLSNESIDVATVHKFQGREKDVIIISTVDNEVTDFSDDPYLLNVAVSRAKKNLCLIVSGNKQPKDSNIADLIDYIEYNNLTVSKSAIYSVFDLLYRQNTESRLNFLKNYKKVSKYDSENLMYALIQDVLAKKNYSTLNVICHQPLNMLIRDTGLLNDEERRYALNSATHLDFLIYSLITKKPILAIEVDGFHFHKDGTLQAERDKKKNHILELYGIPLLRFKTNDSGEREILTVKLEKILN